MFDNEEALSLLRRMEQWLAMLAKAQLAPIMKAELSDPRMAELYKLTGTYGQREIKKKMNMSANTISEAWKRWERQGLIIKEGKEYRKVF
jgi:DNA-binding MarR family transcriptional regulator